MREYKPAENAQYDSNPLYFKTFSLATLFLENIQTGNIEAVNSIGLGDP